LVILSGPSGVGKDAVLKCLKDSLDKSGWHFVVTATTRPKREGERDGVDYVFMTTQQFEQLLQRDGFLEHAQVYGHRYGLPKEQVKEALQEGKDVIVKVDVQGAATLKRLVPQAVFIFLAPPSLAELERRLKSRHTESPQLLKIRFEMASEEMKQVSMFDYMVINQNDSVEQAASCIESIVVAEKCRLPPRCVSL
jgi:guanylate kinase